MSEEVEVESWEDLIKDEPTNEPKESSNKPNKPANSKKKNKSKDASRNKIQQSSGNELNDRFNSLYLSDSIQRPDLSRTAKPDTNSYSSILNKNLPAGNIKILNRSDATTSQASSSSLPSANSAIIIDGLSTAANSYKITFEENTPTHFIPLAQQKVKILQRPKADKNDSNDPNGLVKNGFFNAKTIQEREAEYARARARILGTNYENDQTESSASSRQPNNPPTMKRNDLVRTPAGPSGQAGFAQRR